MLCICIYACSCFTLGKLFIYYLQFNLLYRIPVGLNEGMRLCINSCSYMELTAILASTRIRSYNCCVHGLQYILSTCTAVRQKKMNNSCFVSEETYIPRIVSLSTSAIAVLTCLATVIFVCVLKLHRILFYRLALYQVLSAMECTVVWITQAAYITHKLYLNSYYNGSTFGSYIDLDPKAVAVLGVLFVGSGFICTMLTFWIAIHLFALAMFHKNLKRLEPLYVVSSVFIPMAIGTMLFVMDLPRLQDACGLTEAIGYRIIFAVMILISLLIVVMGTILCYRACRRRSLALSEYGKQHKKVLYEMLPLLVYPIYFLLTSIPIIVSAGASTSIMVEIFVPLWNFTASLLLIFHLCVVRHVRKKNLQRIALHKIRSKCTAEEGPVIMNEATKFLDITVSQRSDTHFPLPVEG